MSVRFKEKVIENSVIKYCGVFLLCGIGFYRIGNWEDFFNGFVIELINWKNVVIGKVRYVFFNY